MLPTMANIRRSRVTSSFEAKRINATTFVIRENDAEDEHPLIFAKLHPKAPVIILSDTGVDEPNTAHKKGWSNGGGSFAPSPRRLPTLYISLRSV